MPKKKAAKSTEVVRSKKPSAPKSQKTAKASAKTDAKAIVYKLKEGDRAPAFKLPSNAGETRSLKDLKGRLAVLYFYPKDATSGCTLEGKEFSKFHSQFKKLGCDIYGVSRDSIISHEKFVQSCGFSFELLSDAEGELCRSFDVIQMKSMYGRKYEGIERSTFVISDTKVLAEWRKVKVNGHVEEVLERVQELKAAQK